RAEVLLTFRDATGTVLDDPMVIELENFQMERMAEIPEGAASVVVSVSDGSIGAVALVFDRESGDFWTVTDWARNAGAAPIQPLRVPFVISESELPARRRLVSRSRSLDSDLRRKGSLQTDLALFNPGVDSIRVRITLYQAAGSTRESIVILDAGETRWLRDVVATLRGRSGRSIGYLDVESLSVDFEAGRGGVAIGGRIWDDREEGGTRGAGLVAVPTSSGVRLGQSVLLANLDDSRRETIEERVSGTRRTSIGVVETAGEPVVVRAKLRMFDGSPLVATNVSREYAVDSRQILMIDDIASSILGPERETLLGDLQDLQLELRVTEGDGAAVFFVLSTDNETNDLLLRVD
ncbi:MAG: hypothetical protein R3338_14415, partial [Thermoanaerobaculia bacterium]|nr:hypothetical protein [Thermoanaerobaculia bacterium]